MLRRELELFDPGLAAKPQLVAANKIDAVDRRGRHRPARGARRGAGLPLFRISGVTGAGRAGAARRGVAARARDGRTTKTAQTAGRLQRRAQRPWPGGAATCYADAGRMTVARRIGLLGGTFDPIHVGHMAAAVAACTTLQLDEVLLLTSHVPPHRPQPAASVHHRFAMVALAVQGDRRRSGRPTWSCSRPGRRTRRRRCNGFTRAAIRAVAAFLHHGRRRVRGNRHLARLPALPRCCAFRRRRQARTPGHEHPRRAAGAGAAHAGCVAAGVVLMTERTHLDLPREPAHARRVVHRDPDALRRGASDHRARAPGRRTPYPSSCAVSHPRCRRFSRRRRTPSGEPVA